MTRCRAARALLAVVATTGVCGPAFAALSAGPELDVGSLHAGPTDSPPAAALASDDGGLVAAYLDERGDFAPALYVRSMATPGAASDEILVATRVRAFALFPQRRGPLLLFTRDPPDDGKTFAVSVGAGGTLDGPFELPGVVMLPTTLACQGDICIGCNGGYLQRFDLDARTVSPPFSVPATDTVGPAGVVVATLGDEVIAASTGAQGDSRVIVSAELDFDGKVRRAFTSEGVLGSGLSTVGLIAGTDEYLLGMSVGDSGAARTLHLTTLDRQGHVTADAGDVPLDPVISWTGAWAGDAYRLVLGGSLVSTVAVVPGAPPVVTPYAQNPVDLATVAGAAPAGDDALVASFRLGSAADESLSNLVRVRPDGGIENLPTLGQRPSQQFGPLVAGQGDRFLVAYQEHEAQGTSVRYALLDASGRELGVSGTLAADASPTYPSVWSLAADEVGFLLAKDRSLSLIDAAGNAKPLDLAWPTDDSRKGAVPVLGGGVVLALSEHSGSCGEDCGWNQVGAERFALDGSALDPGLLFGPPPNPRDGLELSGPEGVWNGREFVVFARPLLSGIVFRRVGPDGTLLDDDWRDLDTSLDSSGSYAVAGGDGVALAVWSANGTVRGARVFADGTTDATPIDLAVIDPTAPKPQSSLDPVPSAALAAVHDGSRFVVAWAYAGVEHAITLESDSSLGSLVALTSPSSTPDPHAPALASRGDGKVLLAYDRFDAAPSARTARIKVRLLADGPVELGSACALDSDCASGFCVEATCCDARCDEPDFHCAARATGVLDGTCAPEASDAPDAGGGLDGGLDDKPLSCDAPNACPPRFTCDSVKLVCIPPAVAPSVATDSGGCGCRTAPDRSGVDVAWLFVALVAGLLRARARARRAR